MIESKNNRSEENTENPVTLLSKLSAHTWLQVLNSVPFPPFSAERDEKTREERWETKALGQERTFEIQRCFMGEKKEKALFSPKRRWQRLMTTYKIINFGKSFDAGVPVPSMGAIPGKESHEELVGLPVPGKNCSNLAPNGLI